MGAPAAIYMLHHVPCECLPDDRMQLPTHTAPPPTLLNHFRETLSRHPFGRSRQHRLLQRRTHFSTSSPRLLARINRTAGPLLSALPVLSSRCMICTCRRRILQPSASPAHPPRLTRHVMNLPAAASPSTHRSTHIYPQQIYLSRKIDTHAASLVDDGFVDV
ncbi:hypothetical protein DPSP01_006282 [Paraphaeosphaeria sporulosa]